MQFLRLIFVRKLQGALPPDPHWGPSAAPSFQLTFPFLIPMPAAVPMQFLLPPEKKKRCNYETLTTKKKRIPKLEQRLQAEFAFMSFVS